MIRTYRSLIQSMILFACVFLPYMKCFFLCMPTWKTIWGTIKKPFAAMIGTTIGATCALIVTQHDILTLDPSSVIFVTVLLVDVRTSESLYVTAILRIIGTVMGIIAGAGTSFVSNALARSDVSYWGIHSFQLVCMAVLVFFPLVIAQEYRRYSYMSTIFIYTVSALIFSGTTNNQTIATITTVVGGALIAGVVVRIFNYESAETTLLRDHRQLLGNVMTLVRISIRANPSYKQDYFRILEETKSSFALNIDNIQNYERWMRWTRQKIQIRFDDLAQALRPLYHEAASLYWSLTRDRILRLDDGPASDPRHLYCKTSEDYFDNFHGIVTQLIKAIDGIQEKLDKLFSAHRVHLVAKLAQWNSKRADRSTEKHIPASEHLNLILNDDVICFFKCLARLKRHYFALKSSIFPNFSQQWLMSDYMYQLSLVLTELLDYLQVVIEITVQDQTERRSLSRQLKALIIRVESMCQNGFLRSASFNDVGIEFNDGEGWESPIAPIDDGDSIESNLSGSKIPDVK